MRTKKETKSGNMLNLLWSLIKTLLLHEPYSRIVSIMLFLEDCYLSERRNRHIETVIHSDSR